MGTKYPSTTPTGYNSSPPPDDGSTVSANKITWATIKTKLTDCFNTWASNINGNLLTALDTSATTTSVNYTTVAADHQKPIEVSGTTTISLGDAATMGAGYQAQIFNKGTGVVTVNLSNAANTLNGTVGGSISLYPGGGARFSVNNAAAGYNILESTGVGAATASSLTLSTSRLLGRTTVGSGAIEEISVASGLTLAAGALSSFSTSKMIATTCDLSLATNFSVTGVGFTPRAVIAFSNKGSTTDACWGFADSSFAGGCVVAFPGTGYTYDSNLLMYYDGTNVNRIAVVSYDADGATFSRTKTLSPTGTLNIKLLFMR